MGYWVGNQFHTEDEPNAAAGYQDPMYPQPSTEIVPSAQLAANPALRVNPGAPGNPILSPPPPVAPEAPPGLPSIPTPAFTDPAAQETTESTSSSRRTIVDPKRAANWVEQQKVYDAHGRAVDAQTAAGLAKLDSDAAIGDKKIAIAAEQEQKRAQIDREYTAERKAREGEVAKREEAWRKAEPQKFWGGPDTAAQVVSAVAMGFGAFAATRSGGRNFAAEIVQKNIEDGYRAQVDAMNKKERELQSSRTTLEDLETWKRHKMDDLHAWRQTAYDRVLGEADKLIAEASKPEVVARGQALKAEVESRKLAERDKQLSTLDREVAASATKRVTQGDKSTFPGAGLVYGAGGQPIADLGPGRKAEAEKASAGIQAYRDFRTQLTQLRDAVAKGPPKSIEDFQARRSMAAQLVVSAKNAAQLGALSGGDFALVNSQIGSGYEVALGKVAVPKLDSMIKSADTSAVTALERYGVKGADKLLPTIRGEAQAGGAPGGAGKAAAAQPRRGKVNGKPAMIYPDGTWEPL